MSDVSRVIGVATGASRTWSFPFRFYVDSHVKVDIQAPAGTGWTEILDADFTLTRGAGNAQDGWLGGTISYPKSPAAVLPSGWKLRARLSIPYTQPNIDLTQSSGFDPRAVEKEFDLGVQRAQQLRDISLLHIRLPDGSAVDPEITVPSAGHLLMMNESGTKFVEGPNGAAIALVADMAEEILAMETRTPSAFAPVIAATTENHGLVGLSAVDGVTPVAGSRILVKNQSTPSQNGIYLAAVGEWTRAPDLNGDAPLKQGLEVTAYGGDVGAHLTYALTTANPITVGSSSLTFVLAKLYNLGKPLVVESSITVQIPTDYATMQAAVDAMSTSIVKQGERININIESGHQLATGLLVQDGDYSHFYITSEAGTVEVADAFVGVCGPDGPGTITDGSVIMAYNAAGPILGTIIDGRSIARTGYYILRNATGGTDRPTHSTEEEPGGAPTAGCVNMLHAAVKAQEGSIGYWENSLATNCGTGAIYAERNSIIHAEFADASNSIRGFIAVRGSTISAGGSKADGCHNGYWALRAATISAEDSTADGCKAQGFRAEQGGVINAHNTSATNCDGTSVDARAGLTPAMYLGCGYFAYRGSRINAAMSDASGSAAYGFAAHEAPGIKAPDSTASGCKSAVFALYSEGGVFSSLVADDSSESAVSLNYNSSATLRAADIDDALLHGVMVRNGSSVDLAEASVVNSGRAVTASQSGVYLDSGSRGNCDQATVTGSTGKDLRVNGGSILNATGCTTTNGTAHATDLSVTQNTLTGAGTIFVN